MAARINTRFVLILILVSFFVVCAVGGTWWAYRLNDPEPNAVKAQEFYEQGDLRKAMDQWGRAIDKDPGNGDYRAELEKVVLEITPATRGEAQELFRLQLNLMRRGPEYFPRDAERHLRLLRFLHTMARLSGERDSRQTWDMVENAADDLWDRVPEDDPQRVYGRVFRGLARLFQNETKSEIEEARRELVAAKESDPDNDLAWEALITCHLQMANNAGLAGQPTEAALRFDEADQYIDQAREAVPRGAATSRIILERMRAHRFAELYEDGPSKVTAEELEAQISLVVDLVAADGREWLVSASAESLARISTTYHGVDGSTYAIELLERHLKNDEAAQASHPKRYTPDARNRLILAQTLYLTQGFDKAVEHATRVRDEKPMTVCQQSMNQQGYRQEAAGLLVDIAARERLLALRENDTEVADAALELMRQRCDKLKTLVDDADNLILLRANARLAHAEARHADAAQLFERLLRNIDQRNPRYPEYLVYAAESLGEVRQPGLAYQRIVQALEMRPDEPSLAFDASRLLVQLGRYPAARALLDQIDDRSPDYKPRTDRIRQFIAQQEVLAGGGDITDLDPKMEKIVRAQRLMQQDEPDAAVKVLRDAVAANPDEPDFQEALLLMLMQVGRQDEAIEEGERYLERWPDKTSVQEHLIQLKQDPVEAMLAVVKLREIPEQQRDLALMLNANRLAGRFEAEATRMERAGDAARAAEFRDVATRARAVEEESMARARESAADHPQFIEYSFGRAVREQDWAAAEQIVARLKAKPDSNSAATMMEGRLALARGDFERAVRVLQPFVENQALSVSAYRGLGMAYRQLGRLDEAVMAYKNAYERNPLDREIAGEYITLLRQLGQDAEALAVATQAHRAVPNDRGLREEWLQLAARTGNVTEVMHERRDIYDRRPDDMANAIALVDLLVTVEPTWADVRDTSGRALTRTTWASMSATDQTASLRKTKSDWQAEADRILATARSANPDNLRIALAEANIMRQRGQPEEAVTMLKAFVASRPEPERNVGLYAGLANFLHQVGRSDEALATVETARQYQDEQKREADLVGGQIAFDARRFEEAVTMLSRVAERTPDEAIARNARFQTAEALARLERFEEAQQMLDAAVKDPSRDFVAAMLAATIREGRGTRLLSEGKVVAANEQFARAEQMFGQAAAISPLMTDTYVQHANFLLRQHERTGERRHLQEAGQVLDRAEEVGANNPRVMIVRSSMYSAMGEPAPAAQQLVQSLAIDPDNDAARRRLVELQLSARDINGAIRTTEAAISRNDRLEQWHALRGDLLWQYRRDSTGAREAYRRAYDLNQDHRQLEKLVDVLLTMDKPDGQRARRLLENHPEDFREDPSLESRYASALLLVGERKQAEDHLKHAYLRLQELQSGQTEPTYQLRDWVAAVRHMVGEENIADAEAFIMEQADNDPDPATRWMLGQAWASRGTEGVSRSIELVEQAIADWPADEDRFLAQMQLSLGGYYLVAGQFEQASHAFERVVELMPDNAAALNNLAYIKAEKLGDPAGALQFSERAVQLRPGDAAMLDTHGWVLFKLGNLADAKKFLREAAAIEDLPEIHLHLAHLYKAEGDLFRARQSLVRAAELKPSPDVLKQIEELDDELRALEKAE